MKYSLTLNCLCGKQAVFSTKEDKYYCRYCGKEYIRTYYMENGEYTSTFKVKK